MAKERCKIYRPEYIFKKNSPDQFEKAIDKLHLSKSIPMYVLNSYHVKKLVNNIVMRNCNLPIPRCLKFKFQVQECQNASGETWVRDAKSI